MLSVDCLVLIVDFLCLLFSGVSVECFVFHVSCLVQLSVGGGVRIHPVNARMSGRHGVQYVEQCVACAALTPVVWQ